ncbi:NADH-quinone oxidoreductase subunit J [Moritella sp.]|uniref:NADH-quinone oxidoreductase subunit J family protein n=1 Tax=Moritella sp. TaxID=78556 RepID=UPI001D67ED76|nr:NADH-quinone oxidoreductase subunit J [Moritella sp.]MCJ8348621.1 NADH-quinone oxidoreductase subunit J [Moritella sp.]NQZ41226.1 NADH-quinone oxidoreductase subunit J [Moritella sp.]
MEQQFFILLALVAIGTGLLVVVARNPIHSALSLVACFVQIAALFVLLGSPFLAVIQLFVYVGAIMVLFLFVIMMLDVRKEAHGRFINNSRFIQKGAIPAIVALLALASELLFLLSQSSRLHAVMAQQSIIGDEQTKQLSLTLFRDFLLPFEVASVILLVALIGAVVLAQSNGTNHRPSEHKKGSTKEASK